MIYGKTTGTVINNFDPSLPVSASNPVANSISLPVASAYGLTVSPVLGSGSSALTFYSIDVATNNYIYYNSATSSWVNTGHNTGNTAAVNIAAGGGFIYSLIGSTGAVYKYDGTGSGTLLVTVPGFTGAAPYDLVADCEGNWYIFNQTGSSPFLKKYNSSGVLLHTWVVYNPLGLTAYGGAGFAVVGTNLYIDNSSTGIATYSLGADTLTLMSTTSLGSTTFANDDLGSCSSSVPTLPVVTIAASQNNICSTGSSVTFTATPTSGGTAPTYQWKVNGSPVGTGLTTYSYIPANGDTVTCTMTSNSPCASVLTVTSTKITMVVNPLPTAPTVPLSTAFCKGAIATALTATKSTATDTLYWYTAATGGTGSSTAPVPSTAMAGITNYYVSEKNAGGCESARTLLPVYIDSIGTFKITTTDTVLCLGKSATLNVGAHTRDSLNSPYVGGYTNDGLMFDMVAKKSVTINGFDMTMGSVSATSLLSVYYKVGSYVGYESSPSSWTLLGSVLPTPGLSGYYTIPLPLSINVPQGQTVAFYLAYNGTGAVLYNAGSSLGSLAIEDASIQLYQGRGVFTPLFGTAATPRYFSGKVRYTNYPNVLWSTTATTDNITVSPPTGTTKYWARVSDWVGCSASDTMQIKVNPLPSISGTLSACIGQTSPLSGSASPDATTPWASSSTGVATISNTGVVTAVAAGTTTITYKNTNGCTQTATFTVNALPTISGTLSACVGQSSTLTGSASPDATTPWASSSTGVATVSSTGVVTGVSAGTTTITYKNTNGCTQTATFTVNALPTISGTLSACVGLTSTLTGSASPDATTPWTSSSTGVATISNTGVVTAVSSGTTTITYKNSNGCTQTATFTVNALPTISGTLSACIGKTSTLTGSASPDATTPWTSSSTGVATISSAGVVTGVSAGTTTITYKNTNGCTQTATFTVNALPTISGTLVACVGQSSTLTGSASPDATTPWASSSTGVATVSSSGVVTGVASGTTTITYKNTNGCTQTATFTVNALPTISGTLSACVGQTSVLTGSISPDATTPWASSSTGVATVSSVGVVTAVSAGTTTITYKNSNGCTQTATFTVNALPTAPTVVSPLPLCIGATVVPLTATGTNLKWYTTSTGGSSASTITPSTSTLGSTNYYVSQTTAAAAGGCEGPRATLVVTVNPLPAAPVVASPLQRCLGDVPASLTATGSNLLWYTAATGGTGSATAPVPPTSALASTNYYVSQTTAASVGSCEGPRATLTININPLPVVTITPVGAPDFAYCHHDSITILATAPTAISLQWSRNLVPIPSATTSTLKIGTNGAYGMTAKDIYGCTTLKTVNVFEDTLPHSALSPTNLQICEGVTVTLYCSPATAGYKYEWFQDATPMTTSITSSSATVGTTAAYKVRVTDYYGCVDTTNVSNLSTYASVIKPTVVRYGQVLKLNNVYPAYQWYRNKNAITGANSLTYVMLYDGSYYAEVADVNGCSKYSDTVVVAGLGISNTQTQQMNLQIYPNPSQGKVYIECSIDVNVTVTDMAGRQLLQKDHAKEVDLSEFADGTYLFQITDVNGMQLRMEKINKLSAQH